MSRFDIIVVGAGAIGCACALRIAKERPELSIALIERSSQQEALEPQNHRVWALGPRVIDELDALGVRSTMHQDGCYPYQNMVVWDENSDGELRFSARENGLNDLGYMVDADRCTYLLQQQALASQNIECFYLTELTHFECQGDQVFLEADELKFSATLVIAADGGNSWLRRQAKILAPTSSYHQRGLVAKIETEKPHQSTAWQRFLKTGPLAVLPLNNNQSSIVWSNDDERAFDLLNLTDSEFEAALYEGMGGRLGEISLKSEVLGFPLQSRQAQRYVQSGLALIGDAAHSIHPLAGQGANLGFRDAFLLARLIAESEQFADLKVLSRYQRERRSDNLQTDVLMTFLYHAYRNNRPWWTLARGSGMNLLSRSSVLKNHLARAAMGL